MISRSTTDQDNTGVVRQLKLDPGQMRKKRNIDARAGDKKGFVVQTI